MASGPVLELQELSAHFHTKRGVAKPVNRVSLSLEHGSVLGLMGESGCGKTMTALSILNLLPYPGKIAGGKVLLEGKDLLRMGEGKLRKIRGKDISLVFQDAMAGLNPILTIGDQIREVLTSHMRISKKEARRLSVEALHRVGVPDPELAASRYSFQLSGGTCQRVMMAMAMALNPMVLIADEPTSGLDVTLEAEILDLIRGLKEEGSGIILITHDVEVIAQLADRVAMMYAGYIVEQADTSTLFKRPFHPYTWGLMQSVPNVEEPERVLRPVPGSPPNLLNLEEGCPFLPRCNKATNVCRQKPMPPLEEVEPGHLVACYNPVRYDWAE